MLEHGAWRDHQSRLARPAHQLDRPDAVAAQLEEVVVDADPRDAEHVGEQRAQQLLLRRARRAPHRGRRQSGAGSARRSSLPFGVSGSASSATNADGTMCSGSSCRQMRPQRRRSASAPAAPPHTPPAASARPVSSRASTAACATSACARQRRLDLARLDAEAAHLHLLVGAAEILQLPVRPPRARSPLRYIRSPRPETDQPRTAPPSVRHAASSPAQPPLPRYTALPHIPQAQAQPPSST